jgi:hypothetical protein
VGGAEAQEEDGTKRHKAESFQAPEELPNKTLFVQNLPAEANELMVQMLFQQVRNGGVVCGVMRGLIFIYFF